MIIMLEFYISTSRFSDLEIIKIMITIIGISKRIKQDYNKCL